MVGVCIGNSFPPSDQQSDLIRRIDAAQLSREANLARYTATEHYAIRNSHFSKPAQATVQATYKRGEGMTYKVLSRSGPALLRNTVLDRLLREESEMSRGKTRDRAIVTSANYDMKLIGQESVNRKSCDLIELTPKRKSPYLLKGRMWIDPAGPKVVKLEGKPLESASFFEGRPQVVREYTDIDGFSLPQTSHAVSKTFLFGQSTIDIEYRDYHVTADDHSGKR